MKLARTWMVAVVVVAVLVSGNNARGEGGSWTGTTGNWNDNSNWSGATYPNALDEDATNTVGTAKITIPAGVDISVNNLNWLNSGAIDGDASALNVYGTLTSDTTWNGMFMTKAFTSVVNVVGIGAVISNSAGIVMPKRTHPVATFNIRDGGELYASELEAGEFGRMRVTLDDGLIVCGPDQSTWTSMSVAITNATWIDTGERRLTSAAGEFGDINLYKGALWTNSSALTLKCSSTLDDLRMTLHHDAACFVDGDFTMTVTAALGSPIPRLTLNDTSRMTCGNIIIGDQGQGGVLTVNDNAQLSAANDIRPGDTSRAGTKAGHGKLILDGGKIQIGSDLEFALYASEPFWFVIEIYGTNAGFTVGNRIYEQTGNLVTVTNRFILENAYTTSGADCITPITVGGTADLSEFIIEVEVDDATFRCSAGDTFDVITSDGTMTGPSADLVVGAAATHLGGAFTGALVTGTPNIYRITCVTPPRGDGTVLIVR